MGDKEAIGSYGYGSVKGSEKFSGEKGSGLLSLDALEAVMDGYIKVYNLPGARSPSVEAYDKDMAKLFKEHEIREKPLTEEDKNDIVAVLEGKKAELVKSEKLKARGMDLDTDQIKGDIEKIQGMLIEDDKRIAKVKDNGGQIVVYTKPTKSWEEQQSMGFAFLFNLTSLNARSKILQTSGNYYRSMEALVSRYSSKDSYELENIKKDMKDLSIKGMEPIIFLDKLETLVYEHNRMDDVKSGVILPMDDKDLVIKIVDAIQEDPLWRDYLSNYELNRTDNSGLYLLDSLGLIKNMNLYYKRTMCSQEKMKTAKAESHMKCYLCDGLGHRKYECPKKEIPCPVCDKTGHMASKCYRNPKSTSFKNKNGDKTYDKSRERAKGATSPKSKGALGEKDKIKEAKELGAKEMLTILIEMIKPDSDKEGLGTLLEQFKVLRETNSKNTDREEVDVDILLAQFRCNDDSLGDH